MDAILKIEAALAAGTRDGPWEFGSFAAGVLVVDSTHGKHWPIATTADECSIPWDKTESSKDAFNNAAFIAACNPAAIREVLQILASKEAELVRLRNEMRRFLPLLERVADGPLWDELTAGTGIATINAYRDLTQPPKEPT